MASKNTKMVDAESAGGTMSDASKRRGDNLEQLISYNSDFDIQRLQHMVVALQGGNAQGNAGSQAIGPQ